MSAAAHGICPNYNRCNKYLECMKTFERKPTDVLPRAQIGNRLGAQCLYDHYVGGMTPGALARRLGLKKGSLASFEKVAANRLEKAIDRLTEESGCWSRLPG